MKATFRQASKNSTTLPQSTPNLAIPQHKPASSYHPAVSLGHR